MAKKIDKQAKKVYRFGLYGLSASGKTCMLAALAMPRYPHPSGYSCTWQPVSADKKAGEEVAKNWEYSKEWMEKSIERLSQRDVPEPNPTGEEQFIFQYDFTGDNHQTFCIELIDYSGELINPAISSSELAKDLRTRFIEMDGILVLAEAPYWDKLGHQENSEKSRDGEIHVDLYQLRQAFSLLRGEKQEGASLDTPVALIVNKWDRYSTIDYNNPNQEQEKLEKFLHDKIKQPPHKGLYDVLHSSITEGNFKTFPASALGNNEFIRLENGDVVERIKQVKPLKTFGLENAFIWLAEQRNAIDLQHYQVTATKNLDTCKKTGLELLNRFPAKSELAKQVEKTLGQCRIRELAWWVAIIIFIPILWFGAETTMDGFNYRKHQAAIDNPQTTNIQLVKAEQWLNKYIIAVNFRHFFSRKMVLKREEAQVLLTNLQSSREKILWKPVKTAKEKKNIILAGKKAAKYLQAYPYGPHAQQAHEIRLSAEIQIKQQENEKAFNHVSGKIRDTQNIEEINQWLEELHSLPKYPEAETDKMRQNRVKLEKQLSNKLVKIASQQDWQKFEKIYDSNMRRGNFLAAAKLLNDRPAEPKLNALKANFRKDVLKALHKQVEQKLKDNLLRDAEKLLAQYDKFPEDLRTIPGKKLVAKLQYFVKEGQDKNLYEMVRNYKNKEKAEKYLQHAPFASMKKEVEVYLAYLNKLDSKFKIKLQLARISWTDYVNEDSNNVVIVSLNGKEAFRRRNVVSDKLNSTGVIGTSSFFLVKPSDRITIRIKVIEEDLFFDDDNGQAGIRKPVSELAAGYTLILKNDKGQTTGRAFFKLIGYPKIPDLPAWHNIR